MFWDWISSFSSSYFFFTSFFILDKWRVSITIIKVISMLDFFFLLVLFQYEIFNCICFLVFLYYWNSFGKKKKNRTGSENIDKRRITRILMQSLPTQRYRRQAVRNNLDIVGKFSFYSCFHLFLFHVQYDFRLALNIIEKCYIFLPFQFRSVASWVFFLVQVY